MIDQEYLDDLRTKIGERLMDATNTEKYPKNESYGLIKQLKDELKSTVDEEDMAAVKRPRAISTSSGSRCSASR